MSVYREGVPKTLPAASRRATHTSTHRDRVGRSRLFLPIGRTGRRSDDHWAPIANPVTSLLFLFCLSLPTSVVSVAQAVNCAPVGATPPAPEATFLRSYRISFNSPTRLAVDASADVYIADPATGRVVVRAADGSVTRIQKDLGFPNSVAVDGRGRVYLGDADKGSVTVYSHAWEALFTLGQGDAEFLVPGDIAIHAATGNVYVTDTAAHRVKVYNADGQPVRTFGGAGVGTGQFLNPTGIFINGEEVLVADHGNARLQRFDLDGNYCATLHADSLTKPQGLWVDGAGRVYVADAFQGQVVILDRDGVQIDVLGEFGHRPGQLRTPLDLVMDSFGRLFVSSANNGRVEVFGIDDYSDPERYAPANVWIAPGQLDRGQTGGTVTGLIEVPGYRLTDVVAGSVTANGVPASSTTLFIGDHNRNGLHDLLVNFDADALLATLPPLGEFRVVVRGGMGAVDFEGLDIVAVVHSLPDGDSNADEDADGDGVADAADLCARTSSGDAVDADGCSIPQYCPTSGTWTGESWRNHGAFVFCIASKTKQFVSKGLISRSQRDALIRRAATTTVNAVATETTRRAPPSPDDPNSMVRAPSRAVLRSQSPSPPTTAPAQADAFINRILGDFGYRREPSPNDSNEDAHAASTEDFSIPGGDNRGTHAHPSENTDDPIGQVSPNPVGAEAIGGENEQDAAAHPETPSVTEVALTGVDSDGDRVGDYLDHCADTVSGEAVDVNGCGIAQLCACDDEDRGTTEDARRRYLSCVSDQVESFVSLGLISERRGAAVVRTALASSCGIDDRIRLRQRVQKAASRESVGIAASSATPDGGHGNQGDKR